MIADRAPADEIAKAAHDLNNLCAALIGFSELAVDLVPPGTKLARYLGEIARSAQKAAALAEHLREVSVRLRSGT